MQPEPAFDLEDFLPYLLNQAAEVTSLAFQAAYRDRHGLSRTQWRIVANLGKFGAMSARDICKISHIEKTKVSRAVAALETAGHLARMPDPTDRRAEILSLTAGGQAIFADLGGLAQAFNASLVEGLGPERAAQLYGLLREIRSLQPTVVTDPAAPS